MSRELKTPEEQKRLIRRGLDLLQHFTGPDGRINVSKLCDRAEEDAKRIADLERQLAEAQKDAMTMTMRLIGEDEDSFGPECYEVMKRWGPKALKVLQGAAMGKSQVASEPPIGKLKAAPESPDNPESPTE